MYENLTIKELPNSEIEISAEIPLKQVEKYQQEVLKKINARVEIPGFRKGHTPDATLIRHIGEAQVMEEVAETAFSDSFRQIVLDKQLDIIGRPEVTITKLAPGNPIGFKIITALFPKFELPDYKTLAGQARAERKEVLVEVTEAEVQETLRHFRLPAGEAGGPAVLEKEFEKVKEPEPLTEETVKKFGFNSLADFKGRIKEDLKKQKERRAAEEKRGALVEKIIAATTVPLPRVVVESELEKMLNQFKADIERRGMKLPDYLEKIKKTEEDLRREWRPDAEKRGKLQFILHAIAKQENIRPPETNIEQELAHLLEHQKDADPLRARLYIEQMLTNEAVFKFLESQK